jgi:hypothetical protein
MPKVEEKESITLFCSCSGPVGSLQLFFHGPACDVDLVPVWYIYAFLQYLYTKESKQHFHRTCASSIFWSQQTGVVCVVNVKTSTNL